jgi:hypothetical protein
MKPRLHLTARQRRLNRVFTQAAIRRIHDNPNLPMDWKTINSQRAAAMRSPNAKKAIEQRRLQKLSLLIVSSAEAVKDRLRKRFGDAAKNLRPYKQAEQAQTWDGSAGVLAHFPNGI